MLATVADWIATTAARTRRRAFLAVLAFIVVGFGASLYARGIRVDTNLEALLAPSSESVMALEELRERQGSTELLNIAIKSSDPEANQRLAEDVRSAISQWPEVVDAWTSLDYTPLRDHALYYLEVRELEDLRDRLAREKRQAVASKVRPGLGEGSVDVDDVTVEGDDWAEGFSDLEDEDDGAWGEEPEAPSDGAAPDDEEAAGKTVDQLLEEQRQKIAESGRVRDRDLDLIWPAENERGELVWEERVEKPVASEDGTVVLVRAILTQPPTDLKFATSITEQVDGLLEELDPTSYAPDMLAKVGGAYAASNEAKSIIADLRAATWLSAAMVSLVLLVGFRSPRGLVVVLVPLAISIIVTVAMARLVLGELNVLTAFLFAVLLGIGVDFAVHLYAQRERQGPIPDWGEVLRAHLRPLAASMLTTLGSFFILMLADFKGFEEFGLIAGIGVFIAFVVAMVMVPALDVLMGPFRRPPSSDTLPDPDHEPRPYRARGLRLGILVAVAAVGVAGAPRVGFERDMRNLRAPKSEGEQGIAYQKALRSTQDTGTPVVILADTAKELEAAVEQLRQAQPTDVVPGSDRHWIRSLVSLGTHMPENQEAKAPILEEIETLTGDFLAELPNLPEDSKSRSYQTHLEALHRLSSQDPLHTDDLPRWTKTLFEERDGSIGRLGLLYVRLQGYDLEHATFATQRFRELTEGTNARGASTRFILGDLTMAVEADTRRLPPLALLVILGLIALDLKRVRPTLIVFSSLALGLLLTFGVMGMWPIRINFYNLVVMPAVVGLGIDASIHLWHSRAVGATGATSKAALVSALTTAGGFSGLLISSHGGLRSIGLLGVIATLCCVVVAIIALGWPRRA